MQKENFKSWSFRVLMNMYPMFFGTGGKITFLSADYKKAVVRLKLNMWTYNYVGTIFGGSQFAALDPFHMVLLLKIIGPEYVVLDKAGSIQFKKPGRGKITATIEYADQEIEDIKARAKAEGKFELVRTTNWVDEDGQVISTLQKTLYIATKEYFKSRKKLDH
ncbi:hypothetical protein AZI86_16550 [Bdellovibrio bacteriovorus]|uniref:DUF4442 domain-containing protein n=1 Tax=Bdellovibrio bacteriovorus TaxID=959 RepID=A0A150WGY9_BDEBC|nr:DUF4442 domain-containing protein [Bdellovibrio bacteriovorus]KYG62442.1 hypothetical protein AZI86_16550 [Bdellovibrio bacteriovorus]